MNGLINEFVGTWELEDSYSEKEGEKIAFPLGKNVIGRINYDEAGNMAAQLMSSNRIAFESKNPAEVTDAEYRRAFQEYTSYFGTYTIDSDEGKVTHHVKGASAPSWPGHDQVRYFEFNEGNLVLKTPPMRGQDGQKSVHTLVWKKITSSDLRCQ